MGCLKHEFIDDDEWAIENNTQAIKKTYHALWKATCAYPCQSVCAKVNKWLQNENQKPGNHVLNFIVSNL